MDLHTHTNFSDGAFSIEEALRVSYDKSLELIAITDHYSEFRALPKRMSKSELPKYLGSMKSIHVIKGLEVDILADGVVSISPETKNNFEIVIGGIHFYQKRKFWGPSAPILNVKAFVEAIRVAYIKAIESKLLDVIAHITWLPRSIRRRTDDLINKTWIRSVVEAASDLGVAIELSGRWKVPKKRFVEECVRQGVKLSLGSDAHRLSELGKTDYGITLLEKHHVPNDLIYVPVKH
jgi:putative hydrolase